MQIQNTNLNEIKLIGISVRTSYSNETDLEKGKIPSYIMRFFQEKLFDQIPNRLSPGKTFCVYTEYESNYLGAYTYFIGEEVSSFDNLPDKFSTLTIPAQNYAKITTGPAPMPAVIIDAWQEIWDMEADGFEAPRAYHADFEVYDERASDHNNIVLDIFVGLKSTASVKA